MTEDILNELKELEEEFSKIYFEIMSNEELSFFKYKLLFIKKELLYIKFIDLSNKITKYFNKYRTLQKKLNAILLTALISPIIILINPMIALIFNVSILIINRNLNKLVDDYNYKSAEDIKDYLQNIFIISQNCETFLTVKMPKTDEKEEPDRNLTDDYLDNIDRANSILDNYFNTGYVNEIPEDIRITLIKMIQDDLQIEEDNLEVLLKIAKEKVDLENEFISKKMTKNSEKQRKINFLLRKKRK